MILLVLIYVTIPNVYAELLLHKVGMSSCHESSKIPWPIFRQLELRYIA